MAYFTRIDFVHGHYPSLPIGINLLYADFAVKFIVFMTPFIQLCLHSTLWALGHRVFYAFLGAGHMK